MEDIQNKCWICRRTNKELESLGVELFHISGTAYDEHTICRVCEDVIFELSNGIELLCTQKIK